ncbi:spore germination protein [Paenibacillus harenae]|uniref:spore germination protein n=1 Tax=Paenibacillus harenae TaxID=306543 RepID=UPI0035931DD4
MRFHYTLGDITGTRVVILYLEGAANSQMIAELKQRIQRIEMEAIVSSRQLIELIQDHPRRSRRAPPAHGCGENPP